MSMVFLCVFVWRNQSRKHENDLEDKQGSIYISNFHCTLRERIDILSYERPQQCFQENSNSAAHDHSRHCQIGKRMNDFSFQFLENFHSRGKYSLSEMEHCGIQDCGKLSTSKKMSYDVMIIFDCFVMMLLTIDNFSFCIFIEKYNADDELTCPEGKGVVFVKFPRCWQPLKVFSYERKRLISFLNKYRKFSDVDVSRKPLI